VKECDSSYYKSTGNTMIISSLFAIATLWKHPTYYITEKWIKKMYLYTIKFSLTTMKNEILSLASKWVELKNIILSKVSQAKKSKKLRILPDMQITYTKHMQ
jgi:hypothetical protein